MPAKSRVSDVDEQVNYACLAMLLIALVVSTVALSVVSTLRSWLRASLPIRTTDELIVVQTEWRSDLDAGRGPSQSLLNASALSDVVLIIKTGVDVAAERLHNKLVHGKSFAMFPNLLVVADASFKIGSIDVFDAIGTFLQQAQRRLAEQPTRFREFLARSPPIVNTVTAPNVYANESDIRKRDLDLDHSAAGWSVDQHKFFTALREAYRRHPQAKWFFMIDDDTYVSSHNLLRVLAQLDAATPVFAGSTMFFNGCGVQLTLGGGPRFCHGGSGIVLSNSALAQLVEVADACIVKFQSCWAGDVALALCLHDLSILPTLLTSFHSNDAAITAADASLRCTLPATFHHVSARLHERLFEFERSLNHSMTMSDISREFLLTPMLQNATRELLGAHEPILVGAKPEINIDDLNVVPLRTVMPMVSLVERVLGGDLFLHVCAALCRRTARCSAFVLERGEQMQCTLKSRLRLNMQTQYNADEASSNVLGVLQDRFECDKQ
jgi:hypothetical protein